MATFKAFRRFNDPALARLAGLRRRIASDDAHIFGGDGLPDRIAAALVRRRAIDLKEIFESFEVFERTRRRLRRAHVVDACAGHGLTGMLYAVFEPRVESVTLVDMSRPQSHAIVRECIGAVAPWAVEKTRYLEQKLQHVEPEIAHGAAVVAVHACGVRTDRAIDLALAVGGPIAALPCCYSRTATSAPRAFHKALGREVATDVHRTYRLEGAGYQVDWHSIPEVITPMNRLIVAWHPAHTRT